MDKYWLNLSRIWPLDCTQYYPQTTAPDLERLAEKHIPGVVMNRQKEWRQWKRDLDKGKGEENVASRSRSLGMRRDLRRIDAGSITGVGERGAY